MRIGQSIGRMFPAIPDPWALLQKRLGATLSAFDLARFRKITETHGLWAGRVGAATREEMRMSCMSEPPSHAIISTASTLPNAIPELPTTLRLPDHTTLLVRKAVREDTAAVASLIREAFSYWPAQGVPVSPAHQTNEKTWAHLAHGGYVFVEEKSPSVLLATVTAYPIRLAYDPATQQWNLDMRDDSAPIAYQARPDMQQPNDPAHHSMLLFEKLAVQPALAQRGIGTAIYHMIEAIARHHRADGLAIETVAEATWLYQWYSRLGFQVIGSLRYPGSKLNTLLMISRFKV